MQETPLYLMKIKNYSQAIFVNILLVISGMVYTFAVIPMIVYAFIFAFIMGVLLYNEFDKNNPPSLKPPKLNTARKLWLFHILIVFLITIIYYIPYEAAVSYDGAPYIERILYRSIYTTDPAPIYLPRLFSQLFIGAVLYSILFILLGFFNKSSSQPTPPNSKT